MGTRKMRVNADLMAFLKETNRIIKAICDEFMGQAIGHSGQLSGSLSHPSYHGLKCGLNLIVNVPCSIQTELCVAHQNEIKRLHMFSES